MVGVSQETSWEARKSLTLTDHYLIELEWYRSRSISNGGPVDPANTEKTELWPRVRHTVTHCNLITEVIFHRIRSSAFPSILVHTLT